MKPLFTLLLLLLFVRPASAADPGRVKVMNGTVYTAGGKVLRGTMSNYYNTTAKWGEIQNRDYTKITQCWKLNSIRLWCRRKLNGSEPDYSLYGTLTDETLIKYLDYEADNAARHGCYVVVDCHTLDGKISSATMKDARHFWTLVAPRYKDRTHFVFELFNEPTYGNSLTKAGVDSMVSLYSYVRKLAPNTHLILFSFGKYIYQRSIVETVQAYCGNRVDWSNASVGFHTYAMGSDGATQIKQGMAKYPLIMTEAGSEDHIVKYFEPAKVAWVFWGNIKPGYEHLVVWDGGYGCGANVNKGPVCAITSPSTGASFKTASPVTITATASDPDGSIQKVEFYHEFETRLTKIGEDASSPFSVTWTTPSVAGEYSLTAKAVDNQNAITTSAYVNVTVTSGTAANISPVVSITSPDSGTAYREGEPIFIEADASDPDGSIVKVEFYRGTTKLGEDATGPYSFSWNSVPAGTYALTAKAIDNAGATTTSKMIGITVQSNGGTQTTTLTPVADAHVRGGVNVGTNYGAASILEVKEDNNPDNDRVLFLKFDLGGLAGSVRSAKLRLYGSHITGVPVQCFGVDDDSWTETGITYATMPAARSSEIAKTTIGSIARYYEWDITAHLNREVADGKSVASLMLLSEFEHSGGVTFNSKESSGNQPQLVVAFDNSATVAGPPQEARVSSPPPRSGRRVRLSVRTGQMPSHGAKVYTVRGTRVEESRRLPAGLSVMKSESRNLQY